MNKPVNIGPMTTFKVVGVDWKGRYFSPWTSGDYRTFYEIGETKTSGLNNSMFFAYKKPIPAVESAERISGEVLMCQADNVYRVYHIPRYTDGFADFWSTFLSDHPSDIYPWIDHFPTGIDVVVISNFEITGLFQG